jgi:hypothetical protein
MGMRAIVYVSSASARYANPSALDALIRDAMAFNEMHGVTGALLHSAGNFLQYIEGPEAGVAAAYERIRRATSHSGLLELLHQSVSQRQFASWSMGFAEPTASELQAITQARWLDQMLCANEAREPSTGLQLMLGFWQRFHRFPPAHPWQGSSSSTARRP